MSYEVTTSPYETTCLCRARTSTCTLRLLISSAKHVEATPPSPSTMKAPIMSSWIREWSMAASSVESRLLAISWPLCPLETQRIRCKIMQSL
eukprot:2486177-Pyramimonas_sp.AAC.1